MYRAAIHVLSLEQDEALSFRSGLKPQLITKLWFDLDIGGERQKELAAYVSHPEDSFNLLTPLKIDGPDNYTGAVDVGELRFGLEWCYRKLMLDQCRFNRQRYSGPDGKMTSAHKHYDVIVPAHCTFSWPVALKRAIA